MRARSIPREPRVGAVAQVSLEVREHLRYGEGRRFRSAGAALDVRESLSVMLSSSAVIPPT